MTHQHHCTNGTNRTPEEMGRDIANLEGSDRTDALLMQAVTFFGRMEECRESGRIDDARRYANAFNALMWAHEALT